MSTDRVPSDCRARAAWHLAAAITGPPHMVQQHRRVHRALLSAAIRVAAHTLPALPIPSRPRSYRVRP